LQVAAEVLLEEKAARQQQPQAEAEAEAGLIPLEGFKHRFLELQKP
jgi:hypothetical protein